MLSITKINSSISKARNAQPGDYLFYLESPTTKNKGDFDDYARGGDAEGPRPFWAGLGASALGLIDMADRLEVQRLAEGFHPKTGEPLVKGAGPSHVMGADLTFSAPKDVSVLFAAADEPTQSAILDCMRGAVEAALAYSESISVTRHGKAGRVKQRAEAVVVACYQHVSSRCLDPQLHIHAFMFNVGKRKGSGQWSALDQKAQFDHKSATGALFRVELAHRLRGLGFDIIQNGRFFQIQGVKQEQRDAFSKRTREIDAYLASHGLSDQRELAALNTRAAKAEPPYADLLARFKSEAAAMGLTSDYVQSLRQPVTQLEGDARAERKDDAVLFELDHAELISELTLQKSVATTQEALALISEKAMGRWDAQRCRDELAALLRHSKLFKLGETEHLSELITSADMIALEADISDKVRQGAVFTESRLPAPDISRAFAALESELSEKVGAAVDLGQQREAALYACANTGQFAFVEGWAGAGKTTMLKAVGRLYAEAGFKVIGCAQAAAASQNLTREAGVRSSTIASLLLRLGSGKLKLGDKAVVILDEAGMVGSREFALLQAEIVKAGPGVKLIAVGDSKQLQPIEAGGIFRALIDRHGGAEISSIQRQKTDTRPLLDWLATATESAAMGNARLVSKATLAALKKLPDDALISALGELADISPKLSRGLERWRHRYDHLWMREVVKSLAEGRADEALRTLDDKGRLRLISDRNGSMGELISAWDRDKTELSGKTIIAATRDEVRELNERARTALIAKGNVRDDQSVAAEIELRDGTREWREFAPGDRIVFTQNDPRLGVANGALGTILRIGINEPLARAGAWRQDGVEATERSPGQAGHPFHGMLDTVPGATGGAGAPPETRGALVIRLDDPNPRGERQVVVPLSFAHFDYGYCLTNHKSQGRTVDAAHVYVNAAMADREWSYVAASRSRHATTLYVCADTLGLVKPDSHRAEDLAPKVREAQLAALAKRMSGSRSKGTTLDYAPPACPAAQSMHALRAVRTTWGLPASWTKMSEQQRTPTQEPSESFPTLKAARSFVARIKGRALEMSTGLFR